MEAKGLSKLAAGGLAVPKGLLVQLRIRSIVASFSKKPSLQVDLSLALTPLKGCIMAAIHFIQVACLEVLAPLLNMLGTLHCLFS